MAGQRQSYLLCKWKIEARKLKVDEKGGKKFLKKLNMKKWEKVKTI